MNLNESNEVLLHLNKQKDQEQYILDLIKSDMLRDQSLKKQNDELDRMLDKKMKELLHLIGENRETMSLQFKDKLQEIYNEIEKSNQKINEYHQAFLKINQELFNFIGIEADNLFYDLQAAIRNNK